MTLQVVRNARSRKEWAAIISADWRKSIDSIIQTGKDLAAAKAELPHGEFIKMIDEELPFGERTARALMKIPELPAIANRKASSDLPTSWSVLFELSKLSEKDFGSAQERGLITSDTNVRTARAVVGAYATPRGGIVGRDQSAPMLPKPSDARKIARATGRLVTADDGNIYSGATKEEGAEFVRRREQTFGIRDAIELIADSSVSPKKWVSEAEDFLLHKFKVGSVDAAIKWLSDLRPHLLAKQKVIDAK